MPINVNTASAQTSELQDLQVPFFEVMKLKKNYYYIFVKVFIIFYEMSKNMTASRQNIN